jgi:hypothetical protein
MTCLAALAVMARYEGIFMVLPICILLIIRHKALEAGAMAILSALPIVVFGLFAQSRGWYFLPNSLVLKSGDMSLSSQDIFPLLADLGRTLVKTPHIQLLLLLMAGLLVIGYLKEQGVWERINLMLVIVSSAALLHLTFAKTGWFYRYEAYLMAIGIFTAGLALGKYLSRAMVPRGRLERAALTASVIFLLGLVVASPLGYRGYLALKSTAQATNNIYSQQYQMGLFLKNYYQREGVAANDIGAINFLADIRNLDLWGLGDIEVARARKSGFYNRQVIESLARKRQVKIAIVYSAWFTAYGYGGVPKDWVLVGQWTIPHNVVCGRATVSFYAVDPSEQKRLAVSLKKFAPCLPQDIKQSGKYLRW